MLGTFERKLLGRKSKIATKTNDSNTTQITSICQPVSKRMPCEDVDNVGRLESMHSLAGLSTSDVDALVAVFVHSVSAADVCAVETEGQAVDAASHV
jgi:hypothetical protein